VDWPCCTERGVSIHPRGAIYLYHLVRQMVQHGCTEAGADAGPTWDSLPEEVAFSVMAKVDAPSRAAAAQVNTGFARAAAFFAESTEGGVLSSAPPWSELCSSATLLEWAHERQGMPLCTQICTEGARSGSMEVLRWADKKGCNFGGQACREAARGGHLEALEFVLEKLPFLSDARLDSSFCTAAARGGQLAVLQWLTAHGCPLAHTAYSAAACGGHLGVIQWLRSQWEGQGLAAVGAKADTSPGATLPQLAQPNSKAIDIPNWTSGLCYQAAANGHSAVLEWACSKGCPWDKLGCLLQAVGRGHLETVKCIRRLCTDERVWKDDQLCATAASAGRLPMLQFLHEQQCAWDAATCTKAAAQGHLDILVWARGQGCPWDADVANYAAGRGDLVMLHWARENGCRWTQTAAWLAARQGHASVLMWMREQGCPQYHCMRERSVEECMHLDPNL